MAFPLDRFEEIKGIIGMLRGQTPPQTPAPTGPAGSPFSMPVDPTQNPDPQARMDQYQGRVGEAQAQIDAIGQQYAGKMVPADPRVQGAQPMVPVTSPYAQGAYQPPQEAPANQPPSKPPVSQRKPAGPTDPVARAGQELDQAINAGGQAGYEASMAQANAQKAVVDRQASVMERATAERQLADQEFQRQREKARAEANFETGRWLQKMETLSKQEPNHQRYWQNQDGFGKALWLLGMAFTGAATLGTNQLNPRNPVLEMLQDEIQQDINSQKERQAREMKTLEVKGDIMLRQQGERMSDLKDDFSMTYARLDALEKAALLRAAAPGDEAQQVALTQSVQWIQTKKAELAQTKFTQAYQSRENDLGRKHQAWLQARSQQFQDEQARKAHAERKELAEVEIAGKVAEARAKGKQGPFKPEDLHQVPITPQTGVVVKLRKPDGSVVNGPLLVRKEFAKDATNLIYGASDAFKDMTTLSKALRSSDSWDIILQRNPEINGIIARLGYQGAKEGDPRAPVTDKDFQQGLATKLGVKNWDLTGRTASALGITVDPSVIADYLDGQLKDKTAKVQAQLATYVDQQVYGDNVPEVLWSPVNLEGPDTPTPTLESSRAASGDTYPRKPITTVDDLREAREIEKVQPGYLPRYEKDSEEIVKETKAKLAQEADPNRLEKAVKAAKARLSKTDDRAHVEITEAHYEAIAETAKIQEWAVSRRFKDATELISALKKRYNRTVDVPTAELWVQTGRAHANAMGK